MEQIDVNPTDREELLDVLNANRAVLFVGAGSSKRVGYPLWSELLDLLQAELTPGRVATGLGPAELAEDIRVESRKLSGSDNAYLALLAKTYGPKDPQHDRFHRSLIRLGCRGVITANYDLVLESAMLAERDLTAGGNLCNHVPVAKDRMFQVFEFLRAVADGPHGGDFGTPRRIVRSRGSGSSRHETSKRNHASDRIAAKR